MSYTIPIGPYHPALEEPVHAKLLVDGERITDAEVFIGYNHRGIEKLCQERNFIQTITLVERVCGICSHSHAWTYCRCIEHIAGMEVSKRAQYIRDVIEELERIHSHLLWLGVACHIVGHDSLFMQLWADREETMDVLENLTGKHYTSINIVGGGCQDGYLNRRTAQATGLTVYAGPVEGTAIGNLLVQMIEGNEFENLQAARDAIRRSFEIKEVNP